MTTRFRIAFALVLLGVLSVASQAFEDDYHFEIERRINAHGEEFMALAQTTDGRYLIIGTESGKLLIWGIAERRIVKQLDQGSAVHCLVALKDPDTFVAAGGPHAGSNNHAVIRKWHISTGESEEWKGINDGSIFSLAYDSKNDLLAADTIKGQFAVWNSTNGTLVTKRSFNTPALGITLDGQEVYRTEFLADEERSPNAILRFRIDKPNRQPTPFKQKEAGKVWGDLKISPDNRYLGARFLNDYKRGVALLDPSTSREIATFDAEAFAWSANGQLILFDSDVAIARITIDKRGKISRSALLEGGKWHASGSPTNMTGQIVSADGAMAWEVFQLGAALVELDLNKSSGAELYSQQSHLYTMDVREQLNLIATGGDDEFVRVRTLSDYSLVKEFKAAPGVPQGVALMDDGKHLVFSASSNESPTRISVADLQSGQSRTLFEVPEPFGGVQSAVGGFIYKRENNLVLAKWKDGATIRQYVVDGDLGDYAVSANGEWLVAANETGSLFRFEIATGTRTRVGAETITSLTKLTITNDGRYVYTTEFEAELKQWDTQTNTVKELASIRGQARTLRLSRDEKEIVIGGNHRDVAVYETSSGERRLYFEIAAADFYVTNVWLSGDRLVFSTDGGVLFEGSVKR